MSQQISCPPSPPYVHPATIHVGNYTGDGNATQAVTGCGFQPTIVFIFAHSDSDHNPMMKTNQMGLNAYGLFTNAWYKPDYIISLDADGFTVGDGTPVGDQCNRNGVVYNYLALKET